MANICSFVMKVRGNKEDIEQFYKAVNQEGKIWMGRGAETDLTFKEDGAAFLSGWCKWSVVSALIDNAISMRTEPERWYHEPGEEEHEYITLYEACKRWNLVMEVYSEEGGCQFQEHFLCDKGEVICEECVEWEEYDISDYESKEEAEEDLDVEFTDEEWANHDDYRITRGGFENWDFEI
jgi:hypothetical protein